jgi:hypothetical protein
VFALPEPTGPHPIGTTYLHFVDEARDELFTPELGDPRELYVQVWYPAQPVAGAVTEPYTRHAETWSRMWGEGSSLRRVPFLWNHLGLVETHSYPEAPPASRAGPCPVLVYSHGTWQSFKRNTSLMEELASHGYVVLALSHAYLTPFTLDSQGDVVTFSRSHPRLRALAEEERRADFEALQLALLQGAGSDLLMPLLREYYEDIPIAQQIDETWARDVSFVLDELAQSTNHVFSQLMDPTGSASWASPGEVEQPGWLHFRMHALRPASVSTAGKPDISLERIWTGPSCSSQETDYSVPTTTSFSERPRPCTRSRCLAPGMPTSTTWP